MATPMARPPSIGEANTSGLIRVRETSPLPPKRDLVIEEINRILGLGLVQKLTVEVGTPIIYERLVKPDDSPSLDVIEQLDFYGAIRNNEIFDFREADEFRGRGPFGILFFAIQDLVAREATPKAFVSSNWALIWAWMGLPLETHYSHLFGIPTVTHGDKQQLPDDVLLLVGADPYDIDSVKVSLRISIDLPRKKR
jgi:hypothetical protein